MKCSVCGQKANDEDVVQPTIECLRNETLRVCELCACDIAMALFTERTVTVKIEDGMLMLEVL